MPHNYSRISVPSHYVESLRVLALKSALADKFASKKVVIFDDLNLESLKTKDVKNLIEKAHEVLIKFHRNAQK